MERFGHGPAPASTTLSLGHIGRVVSGALHSRPMSDATGPLAGRRIVVPETRELDLFARMLEERGAAIIRCPMVAIADTPDAAVVEAWLNRVIGGGLDDLVLMTGEG